MVKANFYIKNGLYSGFIISGHADGDYGSNIVCAAVSSAVMLTVNTLIDFLRADVKISVKENSVGIKLNVPARDGTARAVVFSLEEHLSLIGREYGGVRVKLVNI